MSKKLAQEVIDIICDNQGDKGAKLNRVLALCESEMGPKSSPKKKKSEPNAVEPVEEGAAA